MVLNNYSQWINFHIRKIYLSGAVHIHMEFPPITIIKIKIDIKLYKYYVKLKLCINTMSDKSDIYEFIMALFDKCVSE